jgi:predicted transposase/invertase (TIGR01784 family)
MKKEYKFKKDLISKEIIQTLLKDIAKYFLNIEITGEITFLDKELKRIEKREADIVANINDEYVLHLEIQNSNDSSMDKRMLRYYSDILEITNLPIRQYVIYIGKHKPNFKTQIKKDLIDFRYNFIDVKNIDCELLLNENSPDALVLAILCDFKDKNPDDIISFILDKLEQYTKDNLNEYRKYMLMLETLSENRNLNKKIKEIEMLRTTTYQDLPSYEIGFEKGIIKGLEEGIERGIEKGFEKGIEKGIFEERKKTIYILKNLGLDDEEIAKQLNIKKEEINLYK